MALKNSNTFGLGLRESKMSEARIEQISHDFRTPLNIIIGFAELLLDEVPGKINEEQRHSLDDILNSSQRLLNLVNEIFGPSSTVSKKS